MTTTKVLGPLYPFDKDRAIAGDEVVNRCGDIAVLLSVTEDLIYPLTFKVGDSRYKVTDNGRYFDDTSTSIFDLFMVHDSDKCSTDESNKEKEVDNRPTQILTEDIRSTEYKIKVMQAYLEGKTICYLESNDSQNKTPYEMNINESRNNPLWNWGVYNYWVKPIVKYKYAYETYNDQFISDYLTEEQASFVGHSVRLDWTRKEF